MADSNEATLIYKGQYDNSGVITAMEAQDKAFTDSAKTAEKAFEQISNADSQAAGIAKASAAMRADLQEENAAKAMKTAEQEAEAVARTKARAEQEYLRIEAQAAAAEAQAGASRVTRALERENSLHRTKLQALIGNDEAQEAEQRRHEAIVMTLQADSEARSEGVQRMALRRIGMMAGQMQGLQMAFFGVGAAAEGSDSKFGRIISSTARLGSGALGLKMAYDMASESMGSMTAAMGVAIPAFVALGVVMAIILEHQHKLAELAKHNDWLGDPAQASAVAAAMDEAAAAQARMGSQITAGSIAFGNYAGVLNGTNDGLKDFAAANAKIQAITGLTSDEITKLYGNLDLARNAFENLFNERLVNQQFALERALLGAKKDSAEKSVEIQDVANRQAEQAIKNHYSSIILDTKKTTAEKKAALEQEGKELALQEQINQALIAEARAKYDNKQDKKSENKAAEQVKEYHRMELESAKALDEALAALDQNAYQRAIGKIDAEWAATQRLYAEKKTAAAGNVKALAELDQWYANQTEMFEAQAGKAVIERNALELKTNQDYQKQLAALDVQIRDSKIQATGDAFGAQKQQVLEAEDAANTQANNSREKWTKELGDKVAADKMANDLIEKNHTLSAARLALITKQETEKETQLKLQGASQIIAAGAGLVNAIAGQNKQLFLLSKAAAAAQIVIQHMIAEATLTAQLGIAAPVAISIDKIAMGVELATVAATVFAGFKDGGWTPAGPDDGVAGFVHNNERVVSAKETAAAGGAAAMESRIRGGGGGGDNYHFGDTYVTVPAGTAPDQARAIGENIAQGKIAYLRGLKKDLRLLNDWRISE